MVTGTGISGTVTVSAVNAAGTGITLSSSQSLSDNVDLIFTFPSGAQFAHVAVSFDAIGGDAGDGLLGIYLNNNRFTTNTAFSVSNHTLMATAPLQIGNANLLSNDFNGHIDALRITKSAKYRASKLQRTPQWLDKEDLELIKDEYLMAKKLEEITGDVYHVDHIVPLQGENVSGLHVPWNLQVIPSKENLSKSNKYEDVL